MSINKEYLVLIIEVHTRQAFPMAKSMQKLGDLSPRFQQIETYDIDSLAEVVNRITITSF